MRLAANYQLEILREKNRSLSTRLRDLVTVAEENQALVGRVHQLALRLLRAAEAAARRRGCGELRLEVRADNAAALGLYAGAGYRRLARLPRYYEDGGDGWRHARRLGPPARNRHPLRRP